ncbi:hypothetical protein DPMN_069786 [Dreissena polymorpha]|uniref:Uncharacterized protein n=1 Tax=Dreissena polymorpha TaxID=45954 RepID=A0A9D4BND8_DREPO|nr:hypothetical protein DPMN_069786 [Dreissena polymorpha]
MKETDHAFRTKQQVRHQQHLRLLLQLRLLIQRWHLPRHRHLLLPPQHSLLLPHRHLQHLWHLLQHSLLLQLSRLLQHRHLLQLQLPRFHHVASSWSMAQQPGTRPPPPLTTRVQCSSILATVYHSAVRGTEKYTFARTALFASSSHFRAISHHAIVEVTALTSRGPFASRLILQIYW